MLLLDESMTPFINVYFIIHIPLSNTHLSVQALVYSQSSTLRQLARGRPCTTRATLFRYRLPSSLKCARQHLNTNSNSPIGYDIYKHYRGAQMVNVSWTIEWNEAPTVTRVSTWTITVLTVDDVKETHQEDKTNALWTLWIKRRSLCQQAIMKVWETSVAMGSCVSATDLSVECRSTSISTAMTAKKCRPDPAFTDLICYCTTL